MIVTSLSQARLIALGGSGLFLSLIVMLGLIFKLVTQFPW